MRQSIQANTFSAEKTAHWVGGLSAVIYGVLAWWPNNIGELPLLVFYVLMGLAAAMMVWVFRQSEFNALSPAVILSWAILFRLIGLLGTPIYEDDYYRYLWDAYQFASSGTPYGIAPVEFFGEENVPLTFQRILDGINYPDVATIYGPGLQYLFIAAYWIAPGEVWALQLLLSLADIVLIALLLRLAPVRWVMLYAWAPLAIKEIAFTAHPDGFGALLLIAAVVAQRGQYYTSCAFLVAFSIAVKVLALIAAPFILARLPWRHRFYCAGFVCLFYLPFLIQGGSDFAGLLVFANEWQFNSSLYLLLRQLLTPTPTKLLLATVFLIGYFIYLYRYYFKKNSHRDIPRLDLVFGGFFLIAPVVNAWYLLWLLPFAVIYPSRWAWVFSISVLLSYIIGLTTGSESLATFQMPLWALMLEYGVILLAGLLDIYAAKCRPKADTADKPVIALQYRG